MARRGLGAKAASAFLAVVALAFLFPLAWILLSSFKTDLEMAAYPPRLFPAGLRLQNYGIVWGMMRFGRAFLNSLFVSGAATALNVLLAALAGYALCKRSVWGARVFVPIIVGTLVVPPAAMILPNYFIISRIGLYDSLWGLILPFAVTSFGIFFMRNYLEGLPDELLEAARIDGAGEWLIFRRVVLPTSRPALASLGIISFVNNWNSFTMPLVLLKSEERFTLPLRQAYMARATDNPSWVLVLAATCLAVLPVVFVFLALQRHLVRGVMEGAVKG